MRRGVALLPLAVLSAALSASASPAGPGWTASSLRLADVPRLGIETRSAVDWCGAGLPPAVDRKPDADLTSPRQIHVTYAVPADATDRLASFAGPIATDMADADAWWQGQDPTRTLRFDLYGFPGCTSKLGRLDIGFVRLPRTGASYVGNAGADRLISDLGGLRALTLQKHLVYYDGPAPLEDFVCGTSFVPRDAFTQGGASGIAFVWMQSLCPLDIGTGGLTATVAVHELIHGLGALIPRGAPNECPGEDAGHVCDSTNDILYPSASSTTTLATVVLDVNRNDYYGHSGPWFDVQDSGWLSHLPQFTLRLAAQAAGGASGTVAVSSPSTFACQSTCDTNLDTGTVVTLAAVPGARSRFTSWQGACTGTAGCTVTMDGSKVVTAAFDPAPVLLAAAVRGNGRVTSTPAGISCPGRCSATFPPGTKVRLRAQPAKGNRFAGWAGACHGRGVCTLTADRALTARALFRTKH